MANTRSKKAATVTVVAPAARLSARDELAVITRTANHLKQNPEARQAMLKAAGILTPSGKLSRRFGG